MDRQVNKTKVKFLFPRSRKTIYLYLAKEYIVSFFVAFFFFFAIFFVNQLLLLAEEILSKDVNFWDVTLLIVYSLPAIVSFTFPFASLVGGLMTVGRLASDSEILAFRASGISYRTLMTPLLIIGLLLSVVSFIMGDYFLPRGTMSFGKLYRQILYSNPALELEAYSVKEYQDSTLVMGNIHNGIIEDIVILDTTEAGKERVILAEKAALRENSDQRGVVGLNLINVTGHIKTDKQPGAFSYFSAQQMMYNILLRDIDFSFSSLTPREMSSIDVYREIQNKEDALQERQREQDQRNARKGYVLLQDYYRVSSDVARDGPQDDAQEIKRLETELQSYVRSREHRLTSKSLQIHKLELYKKVAIPFGCLAFVFFFFPVGTFSKKSGRSVGFGIGLLISVLYWAMLFAGQTLGLRMDFPPFLSMWLPNFLIITVGLLIYRARLSR